MAELKPITQPPGNSAAAAAPTAKQIFASKVVGKPKSASKVRFRPLSHSEGRWAKILTYGHTGTGKTYALTGFLRAGLKIVVLSTDVGGSGMSSVYNALENQGLLSLADNIWHADFPDYESIAEFIKKPEGFEMGPGGQTIFDIDPDMLCWDGFTGFQQVHLQETILALTPATKNFSEGRELGLWAEQQDWGMIRSGTIRSLANFLNMHNWRTGKAWHKYVTALENKPRTDDLTKEVQRAPLVQGSAASLMGPAFDIIIETRARTDALDEKKRKYEYYCVGHDGLLAKSRGYDLEPIEPADMYTLWITKIAPKLGGPARVEVKKDEEPHEPGGNAA